MIEQIKEYLEKNFPFFEEDVRNNLAQNSVNSLKNELENLKEVLKTQQKDEILRLSHKIKGILLNSGFNDLAKKFEENNLKEFSIEEIKEKLADAIKKVSDKL